MFFLVWNVDVSFLQWKEFLDFFRLNDIDLDALHDQIKFDNEVTNFS